MIKVPDLSSPLLEEFFSVYEVIIFSFEGNDEKLKQIAKEIDRLTNQVPVCDIDPLIADLTRYSLFASPHVVLRFILMDS